MIHAFCFIMNIREGNGGHGPVFKKIMHNINKVAGTNITVLISLFICDYVYIIIIYFLRSITPFMMKLMSISNMFGVVVVFAKIVVLFMGMLSVPQIVLQVPMISGGVPINNPVGEHLLK